MNPLTQANLVSAMHGEAYAYAKYMLFAEQARKHGRPELADLFERTARTELLEHFAEEAELAGIAGSDVENLRDSISGESYEVETMYLDFAEQAEAVGEQAAADRFREIRGDEMKHLKAFEAALQIIEAGGAVSATPAV